jgi:hypothetical protein
LILNSAIDRQEKEGRFIMTQSRDIVDRLREQADAGSSGIGHYPDLYREAANEIERLRAILDAAHTAIADIVLSNKRRAFQVAETDNAN